MTVDTETVDFLGEEFHVAERIGAMPLMRYAKASKAGLDANGMDGLVAMYDLLRECIHPEDWARFEAHAGSQHARGPQFLHVVTEVIGIVAARPTGRSADSSDGPRIIEPSSTEGSSSLDTGSERVIRRLNDKGRPDLALMVRERQEWLSA